MILLKLEIMNLEMFDMIYEMMQNSFPIDEYRPYLEQKKLLSLSNYKIYVLREYSEILGFVALWDFSQFIYLEHLAISHLHQNKGLGSMILKEIYSKFDKLICLEVEPPITFISKKRVDFYIRNNFYFNDHLIIQPPLAVNQKPLSLYLITSKMCNKKEIEEIAKLLRKEVYCIELK